MKIALTIHALHGGGAERQLAELADYLATENHQVAVITWDRVDTDQYKVSSQVERIGLGLMRESRNLFEAILSNRRRVRALKEQIQLFRPDVVISFTDKMNIVTLASHPTVPTIIAERSDPRKQKLSRLWETWRNRTYPRATAMVALTEPIAAALQTRFPRNHVVVIPNAVAIQTTTTNASQDDHKTLTSKPSPPLKYRALAVGRLSAEKGFDILLKAWKQALSSNPNWELVIVGDGPLRTQLESLRNELKLENEVHFAGWSHDIGSHYKKAHLYISSSHYEAMSRSLLEAMSHQLPVIATRATDGLEELVKENFNGSLVPTGSVDALAQAISSTVKKTDLLREYGERSAVLVQSHAWSNVGPKWLDLIQTVAACNRITS